MDIERLEGLAKAGDVGAAEELWRTSARAEDLPRMATAAITLGNAEHFGDVGARLWQAKQWPELQELCARFGFEMREHHAQVIDGLLANERTRVRRVGHDHVLVALANARGNAHGYDAQHGGALPDAKSSPKSMIAFAVRLPDAVCIGIGLTGAKAPNVSRTWPTLRPWSGKDSARNSRNAVGWGQTTAPDRARLPILERQVTSVVSLEPRNEAPNTITQLETLLAGKPTETRFKDALKLLDRWPKAEKAARPAALARATEVLSQWPVRTCVADRNWVKRSARGKPRDTDPLRRCLVLKSIKPKDWDMLVEHHDVIQQLEALRLESTEYVDQFEQLARFLNVGALPNLRTLHCRLQLRSESIVDLTAGPTLSGLLDLDLDSCSMTGRRGLDEASLRAMFEKFALPGLQRFSMRGMRWAALEGLCESGNFNVSALYIPQAWFKEEGAAALAGCATLAGLRELNLEFSGIVDDQVRTLVTSPFWPRLERLRLGNNRDLTPAGTRMLFDKQPPSGLIELKMRSVPMDDNSIRALAQVPFTSMRHLALNLPPDGCQVLAARDWFRDLETLWIGGSLTDADLSALIAQPMARLRCLNICIGRCSSHAIEAFFESKSFPALTHLRLPGGAMEPASLHAFARDVGMPQLRWLSLANNKIGKDGSEILASAARCARLIQLELEQSGAKGDILAESEFTAGRFGGIHGYPLPVVEDTPDW